MRRAFGAREMFEACWFFILAPKRHHLADKRNGLLNHQDQGGVCP
jgi:hypothetical protein